jgi:hypothetical protein
LTRGDFEFGAEVFEVATTAAMQTRADTAGSSAGASGAALRLPSERTTRHRDITAVINR